MAQTAAQKKAAEQARLKKQLAEAKAMLADRKEKLTKLEDLKRTLDPTPTSGPIANFTPSVKFNTAPSAEQIGPMTGANLGRDAAAILNAGGGQSFSAETKAAGQAYNVSQGLNPDGSKKTEITVDKDAYAILEEAFKFYGLDSLVGTIKGYMQQNIGANEAKLKLKTEKAYLDRFAGNTKRVAAGLNALDEYKYLELENDYSETLNAYGLSDYFGVATNAATRLARQQKMAEVIGNDISADEFKTRISTAVTRVKSADKNTKDAFRALYGIGDTDLVKFFLDPAKGSQELKTKAAAAEISGAAVTAGLAGTSLGTAEELAKLGVDKAAALEGYSTIAGYLPITSFLGDIYSESGVKYDRAAAEAEVFKGTASEKRKREQLKALEEASFSGSSGMGRTGQPLRNTGQF